MLPLETSPGKLHKPPFGGENFGEYFRTPRLLLCFIYVFICISYSCRNSLISITIFIFINSSILSLICPSRVCLFLILFMVFFYGGLDLLLVFSYLFFASLVLPCAVWPGISFLGVDVVSQHFLYFLLDPICVFCEGWLYFFPFFVF